MNQIFVRASAVVALAFSVYTSYSQSITSISGVNSNSDDSNPIFIGDNTLLFTRAFHPKNVGGKEDPGDIWMAKKNQNGIWLEAVHRPDLSTKGYDLALGLEDVLTLLVLRIENGTSSVHQFSKFGPDWNYLRKVNFPGLADFNGPVTGRAFNGGKLIFIAGNKNGGYGNEDIYLSQKTGVIDWSEPVNLGPAINGSSDEQGPFFDQENELLFFSSSSHVGATGKDILISKKLGESWDIWSTPVKWEQISTKGSETSVIFLSKDEIIWTSSQNSNGREDLMTFSKPVNLTIPSEFQKFSTSNQAIDSQIISNPVPTKSIPEKTKEVPMTPQADAKTEVKSERTEAKTGKAGEKSERTEVKSDKSVVKSERAEVKSEKAVVKSDETPVKSEKAVMKSDVTPVKSEDVEVAVSWLVMDENLKIEVPFSVTWLKDYQPQNFQVESKISELESAGVNSAKISSKGYFPVFLPLEELVKKGRTVVLLTKAETGSSVLLKDIQFKAGTSELEGEPTFVRLKEIAEFLLDQPNLIIRINGHTDNTGDPVLSKELSLQRATAVRNYLISSGVNFEKLRISGWGGTKPIASNSTEAGRSKNRRVELTVEN